MTINKLSFGNTRPIVFNGESWKTKGQVSAVANTQRLYTSTAIPEGLLLKKVEKLEQAVDAGGLLIVDPVSDRWYIAVGKTLLDILQARNLGKVASHFMNTATFSKNPLDSGRRSVTYTAPGKSATSETPGGVIVRPVVLVDYFSDSNTPLEAYAVVTNATSGFGTSHAAHIGSSTTVMELAGGVGRTVFKYEVNSRIPFREMVRQKFAPYMLEQVPGNARKYFEATAAGAIEALGTDVATLGVVETWLGLTNSVGYRYQACTDVKTWAAITAQAAFGLNSLKNIKSADLDATVLLPAYSSNEAGGIETDKRTEPVFHISTRLGESFGGVPLVSDPTVVPQEGYPLPLGNYDGFNVSAARASMCPARHLVAAQPFVQQPNYENIGKYLSAAFAQVGIMRENIESVSSLPKGLQNVTAEGAMGDHKLDELAVRNLYQAGDLAVRLERFSRDWDDRAYRYAKSG